MNYKNDGIYVGEWINDLRNGQGKMIYKNGKVEEGLWEEDIFIGN